MVKAMIALVSAAAAAKLTYTGQCSVKGPGDEQTAAAGGVDGTVDDAAVHQTIYKDGYWSVGCLSDEMAQTGDKFGNEAQSYDAMSSAGTSIVRYDVVVERDNRKAMTPQVCFDFCRTVPDMQFFGITNGRDCYCEHYYKKTTGEGTCDAGCDGDGSLICGGRSMSSIYQMHECVGGLQVDVQTLVGEVDTVYDALVDAGSATVAAADAMQASGDSLEGLAEGSASSLAQAAKVAAGPVTHSSDDLFKLIGEIDTSRTEFATIDMSGELDFETRKQLEGLMDRGEAIVTESSTAMAAAKEFTLGVAPELETSEGSTYVSVLRQTDKEKEAYQSVCNGAHTGQPKVGLSYAECTAACDAEAPKSSDNYCTAVQYVTLADSDPLCFMFSSLSELTSYACDYEGDGAAAAPAFLQKHHHHGKMHKKQHKKHAVSKVVHHHARKASATPEKKSKTVKKSTGSPRAMPETKALMQQLKFNYSSVAKAGKKTAPQATCTVRFSDTNGVTPELKDGVTNIDRCFGVAA